MKLESFPFSKTKIVEKTRNQWVLYRQFCLFLNTLLFQETKIAEKGLLIKSAEPSERSLHSCGFFHCGQ